MARVGQGLLVLCALAAALVTSAAAPARPVTAGAPRITLHVAYLEATRTPACRLGYYKNVSGHCVKRPGSSPVGATARCRDGSYSYSEHASGTCSHHGGVARWIHHP